MPSIASFTLLLAATLAPAFMSAQDAPATPAPAPVTDPAPASDAAPVIVRPLAIVPLDSKIPGAAAEVTGALQVYNGRAFIANNGAITAGLATTQVTLPYRGTLRVCASTTVKLAADSTVPAGETPGLMIAMERGAIEASFATGRNSDILLTPDFRILIGSPGAAEVKVRLGANGDTCVDNAGVDAPYVLVTSVFDGASYRVQPGQRVMFQHGSLHDVVDQEKEPCGCPPAEKNGNEFPLAQSEGLAPTLHPAPIPAGQLGQAVESSGALVYNAADHQPKPADAAPPLTTPPAGSTASAPVTPPAPQKKRGFFRGVGRFFKRVFGAD
ncbi:MAG: hypothetical protein ABR987_11365 [Terracidiphilus sp.]